MAGTLFNAWGTFSFDGKLLALGDAPGVVRLLVPDTGAEIAQLTAPEPTRLIPCCFTADGMQLITLGAETMALHIFDLRAIRAGLAELDLDWDAPPFFAAPADFIASVINPSRMFPGEGFISNPESTAFARAS